MAEREYDGERLFECVFLHLRTPESSLIPFALVQLFTSIGEFLVELLWMILLMPRSLGCTGLRTTFSDSSFSTFRRSSTSSSWSSLGSLVRSDLPYRTGCR